MMKQMRVMVAFILLIGIVLFASRAFAFGVGAAYHKNNPLEISAGETKEITFNLQNMPGPEDITARPSITKGAEIISLINSEDILVPVGGSVDVKALINVPSDAGIGDVYEVEITFTTVTNSESGAFGLGSSVGRGFNVNVVPNAEEEIRLAELEKRKANLLIYVMAGIFILIIILVIWLLRIRKKNKEENKV